jgi:hypothetical protein
MRDGKVTMRWRFGVNRDVVVTQTWRRCEGSLAGLYHRRRAWWQYAGLRTDPRLLRAGGGGGKETPELPVGPGGVELTLA